MKKSTKILSLLMALVMIFSLTTVALADDADVTLGTTTLKTGSTTKTLEKGTPDSCYYLRNIPNDQVLRKEVGASGLWQRLPRQTLIAGNASKLFVPVAYAVPSNGSVKVTNAGVIGNCKFSLEKWQGNIYPGTACLTFLFDALNEGTTDVTLTYYYNYKINNITNGYLWYKETATFTVTVGAGGEFVVDPATKPVQPSNANGDFNDLWSADYGAVMLECSEDWNNHTVYWMSLDAAENGYSLSEVKENDGSVADATKSAWPWMCEMTIHVDAWLALYNANYANTDGTHYLTEANDKDFVIKWFWNKNDEQWYFAANEHTFSKGNSEYLSLFITHTDPNPVETKYTVTYTDGVDGAAFADQTYTVKEGDATPAFDGTPEREGYVFLGWEPAVAETVTANATYVAKWEEALTEVKVTANKGEGTLLFLGDEIKVTVKTNVKADNIKIVPNLNGALKQIASSTADDGTKIIWYRVTKIIGDYTKLSFTATATKGNQPSVTDTLTFGVNLRNRLHVVVDQEPGNVAVVDASLRLMHKYPQWNACPSLKFDAAKGEYVMKNAWDLSNQEFTPLAITVGDKTYYVDKTKDGENLFDVIRDGTKEIYVNYTIVAPIKVTVVVNGETVDTKEFDGNKGDVLNYGEWSNAIVMNALNGKTLVGLTTTGLNANKQAVFGETDTVVIDVVVA